MKKILILLALLMALTVAVSAAPSSWAAEEVAEAEAEDLVPDHLRQDYQNPITRREFCDLAVHAFLLKADTTQVSFPDADAQSVKICAALGIVNGFSDGLFRPDDLLTREQAAAILQRLDGDKVQPAVQRIFADSAKVSPWAEPYITWCYENGIMNGVSGGRFDPLGTYTREQSILTVCRMRRAEPVTHSGRTITMHDGTAELWQETVGALEQKHVDFSNGTQVVSGRLNGTAEASVVYSVLTDAGTLLRYYEEKQWHVLPMVAGTYAISCGYLDGENIHTWMYLPQQYEKMEQHCLRNDPDTVGYLQITAVPQGYSVRMYAPKTAENCVSDYLTMASPEPLFPWDGTTADFLRDYTMQFRNGKWCYDAYYYPAPDSYRPTGENVYYRNTAAYHVRKISEKAEQYPGFRYGVTALLHMMDDLYTEDGYIPQENESSWLLQDYAIGSGYYDTRWNSDLMEIYLTQYRLTEDSESLKTIERYADFYLAYARDHHWETENGGWLVQDYSHPQGGKPTHCSLNHQLAELSVVYQTAELLEREELNALGDRMLTGITDCGEAWIRPDGDLHYAYLADGTFGLQDYPYLTYEDLLKMQLLLQRQKGEKDDVLQTLISSKKRWMDANGIVSDMDKSDLYISETE